MDGEIFKNLQSGRPLLFNAKEFSTSLLLFINLQQFGKSPTTLIHDAYDRKAWKRSLMRQSMSGPDWIQYYDDDINLSERSFAEFSFQKFISF